jgi:hypothetical protein
MAIEKVYRFHGIEDLYSDAKGCFFFKNKLVPTVYNNGSLAVRVGRKKYGLKKLRTLAYLTYQKKNDCPFFFGGFVH